MVSVSAALLLPSPFTSTSTASCKRIFWMYAPIWRSVTANRSSFWKRMASYDATSILPRLLSFTRFDLLRISVAGMLAPSATCISFLSSSDAAEYTLR